MNKLLLTIILLTVFVVACQPNYEVKKDSLDVIHRPLVPNSSIPESYGIKETMQSLKSFHYQLQDITYDSIQNTQADIIIIDPDESFITSQNISTLKEDKVMLAYLNIGEDKVTFWEISWKINILEKVEEVAKLGYDGLYLDGIDVYTYYQNETIVNTTQEIIGFVKQIEQSAKEINPNMLIIPQNSPELYQFKQYKESIDGFGKEDTWYYDDKVIQTNTSYLDQALEDGKIILATDYPTTKENICDFYDKCQNQGYLCTVSNRELNLDQPLTC